MQLFLAVAYFAPKQRRYTHRHLPLSFILPAQPASWTRSSLLPRLSGGFLHRVPRPPSPSQRFSPRPVSKKFTTGHCSCYWHSCFFTHSYREAATISLTWKSNSASPLNPMRQKAEKEAETNRLRSSCTLDRRHECCQWHYLVFSHKVIIIYIHNVQFIEI